MIPACMTTTETATYLSVHRQTLNGWRHKGVGPPYVRLSSGRIGYLVADIDAWLAERRVVPGEKCTQ